MTNNQQKTVHDNTIVNLKNGDTDYFKLLFKQLVDVQVNGKVIDLHNEETINIVLINAETMVSSSQLNDFALPALYQSMSSLEQFNLKSLQAILSINWTLIDTTSQPLTVHRLCSYIFEGNLVVYIQELQAIFTISLPSMPLRQPSEAPSETPIRGARDGLVEDVSNNIALLRKRIRSIHLVCETYNLGTLTNTKVAVMYMNNIISPEVKDTLDQRLQNINVESLLTIGEVEKLISDKSRFFSYPVVFHSARPDYIAKNLLEGRFVILVDNNPIAIMGPCNLLNVLRSPEDSYFPILATNIGLFIRLISLFFTVFLPAFFIAITSFHPDQIPFQLLATIGVARVGLPVESPLELFLIIFLMEMFREASFRMPTSIAQTVTVVGGLIIGEASISAGLVSPIIVVVAALTIVASATLINQTIVSTAVLLRFICFLLASILGMFGFIISLFFVLVSLSRVRSFGVPYLLIFTPTYWGKLKKNYLQTPYSWFNIQRKKQ